MRGCRTPRAEPPGPDGRGRIHGVLGLAAAVACSGLISACASSNPPTSAIQSTCSVVAAVLANGPDPDADPVGYAEAQILPLRQIHSSDKALHSALDGLATAYQGFVDANGTKASHAPVTKADDKVNAICPGAAS